MPQDDDCDSERFNRERFEAQKALLVQAYEKIHKTLDQLTTAEDRLIDSGKFAVLGETLAGVAHEIKGPLNAVIASQHTINMSLRTLCNTALELGGELSNTEREELEDFVQNLPKSDILSRLQKSSDLKETYEGDLLERGFNPEDSQQIASIISGLPIQNIDQVDLLLNHRNAIAALKFARDFVRVKTASWITETSAIKSKKLIESLRDYTYDSHGEQCEVSLKESLETILTIYQADLIGMKITKEYQNTPTIKGDPDRISQIWSNLIGNALQASEKQGKIDLHMYQENGKAIVTIKDYGGGIPEEIKAKIFDPFFTTKPKGEGTGLGLSIIKKIVEDHQGEIEIETEDNVSTKVIVKFNLLQQ